jgi:hypothetical protein
MIFKIRASNAQILSYYSFSAQLVQKWSILLAIALIFLDRVSQQEDQTRITQLFLTFSSRAAPIHFHSIPSAYFLFLQQNLRFIYAFVFLYSAQS